MLDSSFEQFLKSDLYATLCDQAKQQLFRKIQIEDQVEKIDLDLEAGEILFHYKQAIHFNETNEQELTIIRENIIHLIKEDFTLNEKLILSSK